MNCGPIPDRGAVADLSRLRRVNARLSGTVRSLTRDISQARHTIPYAGAVAGDRPGQIQARQRRLRAQCRRRAFATGAGRLLACVRVCDTVCRYGGDEFVVVLSQIDAAEEAEVVSDKVSAHLGTPYALGGKPLLATASIGAALCRGGWTDLERADRSRGCGNVFRQGPAQVPYGRHFEGPRRGSYRRPQPIHLTIRGYPGSVLGFPPIHEARSPRLPLSHWQLLQGAQRRRPYPKAASACRESVASPSHAIDLTCSSPESGLQIVRAGSPRSVRWRA